MGKNSQYYELLPQVTYNESKPPPISSSQSLNRQYSTIEDLINIESASKILLGAQSRLSEYNPLDYCYKALGTSITVLEKDCEEFQILNQYINKNLNNDNNGFGMPMQTSVKPIIVNIFRLQRRGEYERSIRSFSIKNNWLLYHGSAVSNFLGILTQGLRVAPPNTSYNGCSFGKGIYFADMFNKSAAYCYGNNEANSSKLMLLCEVALGNMEAYFSATLQKSQMKL